MLTGNKALNEFEHPIIRCQVAFQLAVIQNRLQYLFWRVNLQVEEQHTGIVKTSAGAVVPHQLNHPTVSLVITNFMEQLDHALFRPFKNLHNVAAVRE